MGFPLAEANSVFRAGRYVEALEKYRELRVQYPELSKVLDVNISNTLRQLKKVSTDAAKPMPNGESVGERVPRKKSRDAEKVFVGIASIPQRVACLKQTIDSLIGQVDGIGVFLDKYEDVPEFLLSHGDRVRVIRSTDVGRDLGDAGKFFWVDDHEGYYFTCDDDLIYPVDYIRRTIHKIKEIGVPVVVGWHGSVIRAPFVDYYNKDSRRVFTFSAPRPYLTPVHVLGTGCLGFHTSHIDVRLSDFPTPNMADVYFSVLGQQQRVPFVVIEHAKGEIAEASNSQEVSIFKHSSENALSSRQNTKELQNKIVSQIDWNLNYADRKLNILVIGRFQTNSKGGVFKSSSLLVKELGALNHQVDQICLSEKESLARISGQAPSPYDFALVYAPDPERPDFGNVIDHVIRLADSGCVCAVNFSVNQQEKRSAWIVSTVAEINKRYTSPRIFVAAFSNSTRLIHELTTIENEVVVIPKTLDPGVRMPYTYTEREGIFLGDLAKLADERLVFGNVLKWIEQIRIQLPHVNVYAMKHYDTNKKLVDYIKILPYNKSGLGEVLSKMRLHVCLTPGATFEMVPVEAAMSGTPVIHRPMPHSLSEYLSPASTEVRSPKELGEVCRMLYERQDLWERLSAASLGLRDTLHVKNAIAAIEIGIRKCIHRSKTS